MTAKQKQCLLCYLGHYTGAIDGIWGAQSAAAAMEFQRSQGLVPTAGLDEDALRSAVCREPTDWWEEIEFFDRKEFACKCGTYCDGYPAEMEEGLVKCADKIRCTFGRPMIVSSGLRCCRHNTNVGGVSNSRHLTGKAMDFCVPGKTAQQILEQVRQQPEIRYAYAIDKHYVHMDVN